MTVTFRDRAIEVFDHPDLRPQERLVLLAWLTHASQAGVAWPSIGRLARMTGLGERTARRELKQLRGRGVLEDRGRTKRGALVLRYRSFPQRSGEPRSGGTVGRGPTGRGGPAWEADEQDQENKTSRTKPYPYPLPFGEGDPDQVAFILEWTREAQATDEWWALALAGDAGVVHQVSRAMEASKNRGGYRGSRRYRRIRASLVEAAGMR